MEASFIRKILFSGAVLWSSLLFAQQDRAIGTLETFESPYEDVRALVVGISEYASEAIADLNYADDDARSISDFLASPIGWAVDSNMVVFLPDEQATRARIKLELNNLYQQSQPNDLVIIYFAGHGDVAEKHGENEGYLLAHDASGPSDYSIDGAVPVKFLEKAVTDMAQKQVKVFVITDACRSGKIVTEKGATQTLTALSINWQNVMKLVSSQANQLSKEGRQWGNGHGAFTYFLLEGLSGLADGAVGPSDEKINLIELYNYVMMEVNAETGGTQIPSFSGNAAAHISYVNPEAKALALEQKEKGTIPTLFAQRAAANSNPYNLDSIQFHLLESFKSSLEEKKFIEPEQNNAYNYYQKLYETGISSDLITRMKGTLVLAMQEDVQDMINQYLKGVIDLPLGKDYHRGAEQLRLALELLGPDNLFREDLENRIEFMEGFAVVRSENRKKYAEAAKLMEKAVEKNPYAAYAHAALGRLYKNLNRYDDAIEEAGFAIDIAPNWVYSQKLLGDIYLDQRRYKEARLQYEKTLEIYPNHPWVLNNLGIVYYRQGRYKEAKKFYERSIEYRNQPTVPLYNLALTARQEGRFKDSEQLFKQSIESNPEYEAAYRELGELYKELGFTEAESYYQKAVELEPYKPEPLINLAYLYRNAKPAKALEYTLKAIELNPLYVWSYHRLGWLKNSKKDIEGAEKAFKTAIEKVPHSPVAPRNYANYLQVKKRYDEAEQLFLQSIQKDSLYFDAYVDLGELYEEYDSLAKAERTYLKAHRLFPESPDLSMELANFYFRQMEYPRAEKYYQKTLEIDSSYAKAYSSLGFTMLENGKFSEAGELFLQAIEYNPFENKPLDIAATIELYASGILMEGDTATALQAYQQSVLIDPEYFNTYFQIAWLQYLNEETDQALKNINKALSSKSLTQSHQLKYKTLKAKLLIDLERFDEALEIYNDVISKSLRVDYLGKAICLYKLDEDKKLREFIQFVENENPFMLSGNHIKSNYNSKSRKIIHKIKNEYEE